ncbi:MAG: LysR family transcriptional regulator [Roseicyclus sp.]|nr:LysR family transcriptional regulator [Roseicyclus sp.]
MAAGRGRCKPDNLQTCVRKPRPVSVAPPHPKLPVLNRLRAFEAAARCGGFRVAAAELCATPAAVSHSIRPLEVWAGARCLCAKAMGWLFPGMARAWRGDGASSCSRIVGGLRDLYVRKPQQ